MVLPSMFLQLYNKVLNANKVNFAKSDPRNNCNGARSLN